MQIKCKYCDNDIDFSLKVASEDFNDEYAGSIDNSRANTELEVYNPKRDFVDKPLYYLDKGTRKYKLRTDIKLPDDMQGVSNVASVVHNTLLVKCDECGLITIADWPHPEQNDVYHHDPYSSQPGTDPTDPYKQVIPDFDRVVSNTEIITPDSIVNKLKKKLKFDREDHKNDEN